MPLIVIEGLDGSGKATNAAMLEQKLKQNGKKVRKISFPDYNSDSSALVKMYLSGKFGSKPDDVNAYAASAFYAVDRYASYKSVWQSDMQNGTWIIADRYTTSNAVHQASKLEGKARDDYLDWLYDFEFTKLGLPRPDIVIYLDVFPEISQRLIAGRYKGDQTKKDIHEKDTEYLEKSRKTALYAAKKLGWQVICPCSKGDMLSPQKAFELVYNKLKDFYGDKLSQNND